MRQKETRMSWVTAALLVTQAGLGEVNISYAEVGGIFDKQGHFQLTFFHIYR